MQSTNLRTVLGGLVALALYWLVLGGSPSRAQDDQSIPGVEWEYKIAQGELSDARLNEFGKSGWELVTITDSGDFGADTMFFKRPKYEPIRPNVPPAIPADDSLPAREPF